MNDGIMYTHDVVLNCSHGNSVIHSCARLETAQYLRDWCEAEEEDRYMDSREYFKELGWDTNLIERLRNGLSKYSVSEGEVIL